MLQAFKAQLNQLAQNPKDPFLSTIRKIGGPREAVRYADPLRKMVLALPDMLESIRQGVEEAPLDPSVRRLQNFALTYLYSPTDYLPEKSFGLFGYVDDAYLVANVYERTINAAEARGLKPHKSGKLKLVDVRRWIELARGLLPNEMISIDQLLQNVGSQPNVGFGTAMMRASAGPATHAIKKIGKKGGNYVDGI